MQVTAKLSRSFSRGMLKFSVHRANRLFMISACLLYRNSRFLQKKSCRDSSYPSIQSLGK